MMSIQVGSEQATIEQTTVILSERLPACQVARRLAVGRVGQGDYLARREKVFGGQTVDSLYEKAKILSGSK